MEILAEIINILAEILAMEAGKISPESSLISELGAESIDFLEIEAVIGSRFKIEVNEEDLFLRDAASRLKQTGRAAFPFLSDDRIKELANAPEDAIPKVKDLVSCVDWQLKKV